MKLLRLILALFVLLAFVSFAHAEDSAPEATPEAVVVTEVATEAAPVVATPDPVVIVQPEGSLSLREIGLYLVTGIATIALCIVAYRLTTMVGVSFPPGTAESLNRAYETGQTAAKNSSNKVDDLIVLLGDPLVKELLKAVKEREKNDANLPPGWVPTTDDAKG